jgi:predicted MPP superfamily phosphohydrolase
MSTRRPWKTALTVFSIPVLLLAYAFFEPYLLKESVTHVRDADIPEGFTGKKIVFISDIHHGPFFSRQRVAGLVKRANGLGADIILLGGDYVHRGPQYIIPCFEELSRLSAPLGVYGVLGNHDHWEGAALTRQKMKEAGITLIDNRAVWVESGGGRIRVGGVGDYWEDVPDIRSALEGTSEEDFVMLVSHNPDVAAAFDARGVDLLLAGHTHGGQVTLFGLWAPLVPSNYGQRFRGGTIKTGSTTVLVSSGVGTVTPPVRFFARPEIHLIVLNHPD